MLFDSGNNTRLPIDGCPAGIKDAARKVGLVKLEPSSNSTTRPPHCIPLSQGQPSTMSYNNDNDNNYGSNNRSGGDSIGSGGDSYGSGDKERSSGYVVLSYYVPPCANTNRITLATADRTRTTITLGLTAVTATAITPTLIPTGATTTVPTTITTTRTVRPATATATATVAAITTAPRTTTAMVANATMTTLTGPATTTTPPVAATRIPTVAATMTRTDPATPTTTVPRAAITTTRTDRATTIAMVAATRALPTIRTGPTATTTIPTTATTTTAAATTTTGPRPRQSEETTAALAHPVPGTGLTRASPSLHRRLATTWCVPCQFSCAIAHVVSFRTRALLTRLAMVSERVSRNSVEDVGAHHCLSRALI